MSRTLEHAPLPWAVGCPKDADLDDWCDLTICQDDDADMRVAFLANDGTVANRVGRANAAFIVRAVNNHYELLAALSWALIKLQDARACGYGGVEAAEIDERYRVMHAGEGRP